MVGGGIDGARGMEPVSDDGGGSARATRSVEYGDEDEDADHLYLRSWHKGARGMLSWVEEPSGSRSDVQGGARGRVVVSRAAAVLLAPADPFAAERMVTDVVTWIRREW